jgi:hypothetical protein
MGVALPKADYRDMEAAMRDACAKANLQPTEYFLLKVSPTFGSLTEFIDGVH